MATPTSHPRPSPQKYHLTPTASGLSPPPPSSTHSQASKKPLHSHYRNGSLQHNQPSPSATPGGAGGIAMSRSGTANGGTPMARTGTNTSSVGKTPSGAPGAPGRAGRGMSASTASAAGSPGLTAAAASLAMQGGARLMPQMGLGLGLTPLGLGMEREGGVVGLSQAVVEEERRRRLEVVKGMVGARAAGLVSQEGVERVGRQGGLECLWEEGMGMGVGEKRVLNLAGNGLLIEVDFRGDVVAEVGLSFPASKEGEDGVARYAKKGSEVLKRDLVGDGMQVYVEAEEFQANLRRLATMDQLGGEDVSCFDAVDGIFKSMERINKWEVNNIKSGSEIGTDYEVMCNHSGKPLMHAERRVGLALQYWKDQRRIAQEEDGSKDVSSDPSEDVTRSIDGSSTRPWTIIIECEAYSAQLHDSIKQSDRWVSDNVERPADQELDALHISINRIDWLDVKLSGFANDKTPDVRFVARLEPPVLVPLQLALQIQQSSNAPVDQTTILPMTYEAQVFADIDSQNPLLTNPRTTEHAVISLHSDKPQKTTYTLFNQSQDFALAIAELPFKHPMQVVNLLPILRQWALVSSLLRRTFHPPPTPSDTPAATTTANNQKPKPINNAPPHFQTLEDELASFLSPPSTIDPSTSDANDVPSAVEISFITTPLPRFTVHFQNPKYGGKLAGVSFSIGLNGTFEGVEVDDGRPPSPVEEEGDVDVVMGGGVGGMGGAGGLAEKVRRVLEIGESIGGVVEWLCR